MKIIVDNVENIRLIKNRIIKIKPLSMIRIRFILINIHSTHVNK